MRLTIGEQILLTLADIADEINYQGELRRRGSLDVLNILGRKKHSVLTAAIKLLSAGDIERVVKDGEVYYEITGQGRTRLCKRIKLDKLGQKWDGRWRILIFDIPEKTRLKRDYLRQKLYALGFGHLQKSVWVSPFDITREVREFLRFQGLDEGVILFEAKRIGEYEDKEIADRAWHLRGLSEKYKEIVESFTHESKGDSNAKQKFASQYLDILNQDPILPQRLLFPDWGGDRARKLFLRLPKLTRSVSSTDQS